MLVKFIKKHVEKSSKLTMLVGFYGFPHDWELLKNNTND
jgi:hypothetical protein